MHKQFYASGFLYHPASQQILLHASPSDLGSKFKWTLFSGKNIGEEEPIQTFQRVILDTLDLTLTNKHIRAVYDYFDDQKNAHHYVFYAVLEEGTITPTTELDESISWFIFKQLSKTSISPQDKQDIIVSERVINAEIREQLSSTENNT